MRRPPRGIAPTVRSDGTGTFRGAPWISRRGSSAHARQNGVKTTYGLTLPMSAMKLPGRAARLDAGLLERLLDALVAAMANGETSEAK